MTNHDNRYARYRPIMRFIQFLFIIFILVISNTSFAVDTNRDQKYMLIYSGIDTCEGCPEAIADTASKAALQVKYVSDPKQIPELLKHAAIFAIGGTEDDIKQMHAAFKQNIVDAIKNYLQNGGHYLGICGGAFIASARYMEAKNSFVTGFNLVPAVAVDYSNTSKAYLETVRWQEKNASLYFQGGPKFILDKDAKNISIIARYSNGDIAAFAYAYGKGSVVVIGPHPEADKTWLEEDGIDASHWQPRQDLLVSLIRQILQ